MTRGFLQVFVPPDTTGESTECTVCICQSVIHFLVIFCVRGDAPWVGELLYYLFCLNKCNVGWVDGEPLSSLG